MSKREVAGMLLKIKAVILRPDDYFTFASGLKSPVYCDNRLLISYPEERKRITQLFSRVLKKHQLSVDVIAGTATAGIPFAAWLAEKEKKPMVYVRAAAKEHGTGKLIEGQLQQGQKVVVVEDLVSTGGSSLQTIKAIRDNGGIVVGCLCIFTYGFPAAEKAFKEAGCMLYPLSDFPTLVKVAKETGYVTEEQAATIKQWNKKSP
ncbi:orotate phosphoribosyltransferase [Candidatus Woesearchaeota archaeon]|nr:orotate phosphoribosyltransferase [Candidatus Woesearchaeota archaeon]